ncbi:RlmE family RNA methyltransferase [Bartonella sp. DGB1]|uniref:RlmE family RNA methyltransferase n=1 Tax=Bartonella sp. DGB1 TaxID=3239807 RepID=UPI003525D733
MTKTGGRGGRGTKKLHERVRKKAGKIKASSRRWLERHINDPYVHKSKEEGYRSRAAFKLIEINEKYKFLKPGQRIIDLGAAPGGWSQVAAEIVKSTVENPLVVGIDYLEISPLPAVTLLQMDFLDENAPDLLLSNLGGYPDVILSDMAAPTTGHRRTDHLRTAYLCEVAVDFAVNFLKKGGHFLAKTFQGGAEDQLLNILKQNFQSVHHVKPPASRTESVELYLLAKNFKGRANFNNIKGVDSLNNE